jgi:gp68
MSYSDVIQMSMESAPLAIIGVDPGVTTGVAIATLQRKEIGSLADVFVEMGQLSYGFSGNGFDIIESASAEEGEAKVAAEIAQLVRTAVLHGSRVVLVIEDFVVRRFDSSREFLSPVRITARIQQELFNDTICQGVTVAMQSPSDAKQTCTDERMKKWGIQPKTHKDRHGLDAARHCVLFIRKLMANPNQTLPG